MEKEIVKRSWCPWLAIGSWLAVALLTACLCFLCVDLFKKKIKIVTPYVQEEFVAVKYQKEVVQPIKSSIKIESELKIDVQKSYEDIEKELNKRVEELEAATFNLDLSISRFEESIRNLSSKFDIDETRISTAETRIKILEERFGAVEKH